MSELNIKMVPLSAIDYAINEASEGWNQFLDTEEMKVVAIPEDPEEMDDLYIPDEEIKKLVIENKDGRFILMPSEDEVAELDDIYMIFRQKREFEHMVRSGVRNKDFPFSMT